VNSCSRVLQEGSALCYTSCSFWTGSILSVRNKGNIALFYKYEKKTFKIILKLESDIKRMSQKVGFKLWNVWNFEAKLNIHLNNNALLRAIFTQFTIRVFFILNAPFFLPTRSCSPRNMQINIYVSPNTAPIDGDFTKALYRKVFLYKFVFNRKFCSSYSICLNNKFKYFEVLKIRVNWNFLYHQ
jgi:hypothetical protein